MKKILSIIGIIAGSFILLSVVAPIIMEMILKALPDNCMDILGGADGPTAFFIVGAIGTRNVIVEVVIGVLLVVVGIWGLKKIKK